MQEQGKPSGTCMFGSGWEGGWVTLSMSEQSQHLVGMYLSVLVLQRQPELIDHMYIHLTIPRNTAWTPHLPLAMWGAPTHESYSEVKLLTSGYKDPNVYSESNFYWEAEKHLWKTDMIGQEMSSSNRMLALSWLSFAPAKHPLVSPNRRCSATIFIATEKNQETFWGDWDGES